MKWLDYHTHAAGCQRYNDDPEVVVVQSLQFGEAPHPRADYATIGLHPMLPTTADFLRLEKQERYQILQKSIADSSTPIIGIGECGWDKRGPLSELEQEELMELQATMASELNLPIIIHCVSYWHLLLGFQKRHPNLQFIVHGFRGNHLLAQQLIHAGIHLSLHPLSILKASELPQNFLIETDETDFEVRELYHEAAEKIGMDSSHLRDKIFKGFYHLHLS